MTYYYPAVVTKKKDGYRVDIIDLEDCYGEGGDLEDALENARYAGVTWIQTEVESGSLELPAQTHIDDITLQNNQSKTMLALLMPREGYDE